MSETVGQEEMPQEWETDPEQAIEMLVDAALDLVEGDLQDVENGVVLGSDHAENLYTLRNLLVSIQVRVKVRGK